MYTKGVENCFGAIIWHFEFKLALKKNFDTSQQQCKKHVPCTMCHVRFEHKSLISEHPAHWTMGNRALCSSLCSPLLLIFVIEVFYFSVSASHRCVLCDELHWLTDWTLFANTVFWQHLEHFDSSIRNTLLSSR